MFSYAMLDISAIEAFNFVSVRRLPRRGIKLRIGNHRGTVSRNF